MAWYSQVVLSAAESLASGGMEGVRGGELQVGMRLAYKRQDRRTRLLAPQGTQLYGAAVLKAELALKLGTQPADGPQLKAACRCEGPCRCHRFHACPCRPSLTVSGRL